MMPITRFHIGRSVMLFPPLWFDGSYDETLETIIPKFGF
jgi:hypothetical protein